MPFPYRKVLVLGATSGIGRALASRFIAEGSRVVVVGRRQDRLDDFVAQHGADKAAGFQFDLSRIPDLPAFAARVGAAHPDLDCVLVNQGVQRILDFSKPDTVAMDDVAAEMTVNYLSAVALTRAFLPLLQQKSAPTTLM
ncbi:Short-chain dehydrogenase/reductase SDR [Macrophomina phaseolina MS6]|uniref:Short-chain dehydrogenase/reductase SDR n=1 Tax=Macrophomina phaseolina (strain MS6) TaxID=1126212 RepID=K2QKM2_MACPH|nr:Short-chain dehydrogenase/reductase SDR [Macrophomina phaseolina MS6]